MRATLDELYEAIFENPFLRWRLSRSAAYSWRNLVLLFGLAIVVLSSCARFVEYIHVCWLAASFPEPFRDQILEAMNVRIPQKGIYTGEMGLIGDGIGIEALLIQHLGLLTILFWLLSAILFARRFRRGVWDSPASEEMRVLPFAPHQILFAMYDWSVLKGSVCFFIALPFCLLPGRLAPGLFYYTRLAGSVRFEWPALLAALTLWCLLLALHRTTQRLWFNVWTIYRSRMILAWFIWSLLTLPMAMAIVYNTVLKTGWLFLGFTSIQMLANAVLLTGYIKTRKELFTPEGAGL